MSELSYERFVKEFAHPRQPFLLTGLHERFPAFSRWDSASHFLKHPDVDLTQDVDCMLFELAGTLSSAQNGEQPLGEALTLLEGGDRGQGSALYMKWAYGDTHSLLPELDVSEFYTSTSLTEVPHPFLLKPGGCFRWMYIGETGSGSQTHTDVLNSAAWLMVITGTKEWRCIHGQDTDSVRVSGTVTYPDLFDPHPDHLPILSAVRCFKGLQTPGTAMFVPSLCVHAVLNRTFTIAATHNYVDSSNAEFWKEAMEQMLADMNSASKSDAESPAASQTPGAPRTQMDILVFNPRVAQGVRMSVAVDWVVPEPLTELAMRRDLHKVLPSTTALAKQHDLSERNCVGVAVGYDLHTDAATQRQSVTLYYVVPSAATFQRMFPANTTALFALSEPPQPRKSFPRARSFAGDLVCFPPLAVLMGVQFWFMRAFATRLRPLVQMLEQDDVQRVMAKAARATACPTSSATPSAGNAPVQDADTYTTWHYSRFRWVRCDPWCGVYLFYCSPDLTTIFNLFPLHEDSTLASNPPVQPEPSLPSQPATDSAAASAATTQTADVGDADMALQASGNKGAQFWPHFVRVDISRNQCNAYQPQVIVIEDLLKDVSCNLVLTEEWEWFQTYVQLHGLDVPSFLDQGFDKLMVLILYFYGMDPGSEGPVCGFWYDHLFSNVAEPHSCCLTAAAATVLCEPHVDTAAAHRMRRFCMAAETEASQFQLADLNPSGALQSLSDMPLEELCHWALCKYVNWDRQDGVGEWVRGTVNQRLLRALLQRVTPWSGASEDVSAFLRMCIALGVQGQTAPAPVVARAADSDSTPGHSAAPGTSAVEDQSAQTPLDQHSTVLVVGATRGIGLEFVRQLLLRGCAVVGTHRQAHAPEPLQALAVSQGLRFLQMDVADPRSIQCAAKALEAQGTALTHIIHSAGIYGPQGTLDGRGRKGRADAPAVTKDAMMTVFEVNAVGPLLVAQAFAPLLKPSASCMLPIIAILTSKVGSIDDNSSGGAYAYRTSKAACNAVARSLYVDLNSTRQATVCLLHPGFVRTDMTSGKGLIDCDESVSGMIKAIEATGPGTPFRWVDYKACLIPW